MKNAGIALINQALWYGNCHDIYKFILRGIIEVIMFGQNA